MRRCAIILGLLLLIGADAAPTTNPDQIAPATQPGDPVAGLIAQLDDPDFSVRAMAEAKLEALGPSIEPELRAALKGNLSDEARARINHLLAKFDETRSMHAIVTLHYDNAPAIKVLRDFAAQAGSDLGLDDPSIVRLVGDRSITVNLDNAGFWQALTALEDAVHLSPSVGQTGVTLAPIPTRTILPLNLHSPAARIAAGILIYPRGWRTDHSGSYDNPQISNGSVNVEIDVIPEPKLHVIGMTGLEAIKECVDDHGNSLVQLGVNRGMIVRRVMNFGGPRLVWWPLVYSFRDFPGMGTKISRLKAELDLDIQTRSRAAEIDDITRAANTTKDDGELAVTILSCSRVGQTYEIYLRVRGTTMNSPLFQQFVNSMQLVDETGQAMVRQTFIPRPQADGIYLRVGFLPTGATPAKLQWERTLEQKRISVPFELNDLQIQ